MHMADALISPAVGGTMFAATAGVLTYSISKIKNDMDDRKVPLMGVMGAFVFAAQMINFTIPGTGSSGHIAGGTLLAILLGPYAGFLTLSSILIIQSLFFADGGLLALGCNIINMGFFTCFIAYPYIYKKIIKKGYSNKRLFWATLLSSIVGLQLGAFSVTLQTLFSGKTELPFLAFVAFMQPIHLIIGILEGIVTAAVLGFIYNSKPELLYESSVITHKSNTSYRKLIAIFTVSALIIGGFISIYASSNPDGLEWSTNKVIGSKELSSSSEIHNTLNKIQDKLSILPDYDYKDKIKQEPDSKIINNSGTTVSGILGGIITLVAVGLIGLFINIMKKRGKVSP